MIGLDRFISDVRDVLHRDIGSNPEQLAIVSSDFDRCLKVVAGPGSGKTTVIVLRLLKMIYVDDVSPAEIIATTFTRKAASELKSRILEWGLKLQRVYINDDGLDPMIRDRIRRLNFNLVVTGTLDSIAEESMTRYRKPDENPPIVVSGFVAKQIMMNEYFAYLKEAEHIKQELREVGFAPFDLFNVTGVVGALMDINSRAAENFIEVSDLQDRFPWVSTILVRYRHAMKERQYMDFTGLESAFQRKIEDGSMDQLISGIRVLMVDEYQDTNLQQEAIYKCLASRIVPGGGSMIVVGDDDQSIYRFRGSRVHLFADLEERFADTSVRFETAFLAMNYRSTPSIVGFCNRLITADRDYQDVRVGSKPPMKVSRIDCEEVPVLGIFRDTPAELARDIARMVHSYVTEGSYTFICTDGSEYTFERDPRGSAADFALLMSSTKNVSSGEKATPRLPLLISEELESMGSGISIFNPRGNDLFNDPNIMTMCGLVLECIDPECIVQGLTKPTKDQGSTFQRWREMARDYIAEDRDFNGHKLSTLVDSWKEGRPYPRQAGWSKSDVSVIDLMSNLITWMPELRNDAESLVYYQALCDTVANSVLIRGQEYYISFKPGTTKPTEQSVRNIINKILKPIADGTIDIDEDLFFSVSLKDRLSIMTIHQSKGLEFPITIVDVSSDMTSDRKKNQRYPDSPDRTSVIERLMREHSDRIPKDRGLMDSQFDDVIRKYFVGFSRAQDVLILVGLNRTFKPDKPLKHMALGWDRHDGWAWRATMDMKMMR